VAESESLYDWRFNRQSLRLGDKPLEINNQHIFQLNTCGHCPYVTSFLTRGGVCLSQLLLVLASAVILRSERRGTHDHILLSQIRDSTNQEGQIPIFIFPRNRILKLPWPDMRNYTNICPDLTEITKSSSRIISVTTEFCALYLR
jgi:hypothetical protein